MIKTFKDLFLVSAKKKNIWRAFHERTWRIYGQFVLGDKILKDDVKF